MNTRRPIERHVIEPEITDARIARQWAGTEQRIAKMAQMRWRLPAFSVAFAIAGALLFLFVHTRKPEPITEGALLESTGPQSITLNDGSRVDLAPRSRVHVNALEPKHVELALEQGSAVFDVRHLAGRRFVVQVGRFDIVDIGTRFGVELTGPDAITVVVEEGTVRIERRDSSEPPRFLSGGERWSTSTMVHAAPLPVVSDAGAASPPSAPSPPDALGTATQPDISPRAATPAPSGPSPRELLESAQRAQRAGHLRDAAASYDRLRRTFRADARAGLAAFELGRLRLDSLGDPRGAAGAFQDAIALSPNAPFREDAEARLVDALDAAGDVPHCASARSAYLADYPRGLHVGNVSARCAGAP